MLSKELGFGDNWITVGSNWLQPDRQFDPTRKGLMEALELADKLGESLKISLHSGEYISLD